jgi:hypothetical protein
MSSQGRPNLLAIVREHNSLNGLRFVLVEFLVVALAAAFIAIGGILQSRGISAIAGIGIAANAVVVIVIAAAQLRAHDQNVGILKFGSVELRARIAREYPHLNAHTTAVLVCVLIPFLLLAVALVQRIKDRPATGR